MSVGKSEVTEAAPASSPEDVKQEAPLEDSGHDSHSATPGSERAQSPQEKSVGDISHLAPDSIYRLTIVAPGVESFQLAVNPSELVQEIHQVLLEKDTTCHRTCFSLQLDGKKLDNFTEIRGVEGLEETSTLHVVEEPYTVREARVHVRHVRELVRGGCTGGAYEAAAGLDGQSLSYLPAVNLLEKKSDGNGKQLELPPDYILPGSKERPLLPLLAPVQKVQPAVNNIALSPFNPPVGPRKLKGDILYLDIETIERRHVHVTCSSRGFFVNASSDEAFKPHPANQNKSVYHSLVDLLNVVSPGFKKAYPSLLKKRIDKHVLDRLPTPYPVHSWIAQSADINADALRAEDATQPHRVGFEDHLPGQIRDWNEELQTTHEMPRTTISERLVRDRSVFKIHGDFIGAAVKGATAVIDGNVMAINPADEPKTHMFIWNNIFFSLGFDVKDHYKELGGDAAAHAATCADLQGVRVYSTVDDPKICTLGMAVIDYKGYRIIAQSIIPGILEREQEQSVVYGSIDFGKTVVSNDKYVELLEKSSEELKLLPHEVMSTDKDGNEKTVKLYTSFETKGIIGNDGRSYILDLLRTLPPDVHFLENVTVSDRAKECGFPRKFPHKLAALRQELVEAFVEDRYMTFIRVAAFHVQQARMKDAEEQKEKAALTEGEKKNEENKESVKEEALPSADDAQKIVEEAIPSKEEAEINKKSQEVLAKAANAVGSLSDSTFDIRFNPDAFSTTVTHAPSEDLEKQRTLLVQAADFLLSHQVPMFVQECLEYQLTPIDGEGLSELMHSKGINIRYMGEVMKKVVKADTYMRTLVACELVSRSAKHVIRKILQDVTADQLGLATSHVLNALLGNVTAVSKEEKKDKKSKKASGSRKADSKWADVSTKSLWTLISEDSLSYYGFDLSMSSADEFTEKYSVQKVSFFRRVCRILGVQMLLKDYQLEKKALPFQEDDVQNMCPVIKHKQPWARDAKHLYMRGQAETSQGRLRDAYECVVESVNLMNTVYGAMHPELAQALRLLARLSYILGDPAEALAQQHKAAIMSERCNGVDHALTIVEYINLAHFCFANLFVSAALRLLYRARYLLLIAHGENHPLMGQIDGNIGVILYAVQEFDLAVKFLNAAEVATAANGEPKRLKSALLNHMMARAQSCRGDFRAALASEKETYTIYSKLFGADHERTKDSSECLKHLTQQAVMFQKRMNEAAKGNNIQQLLPITANTPSFPSILEVMNALNGIIIITMPQSSESAESEAAAQSLNIEEVKEGAEKQEAIKMEEETLD